MYEKTIKISTIILNILVFLSALLFGLSMHYDEQLTNRKANYISGSKKEYPIAGFNGLALDNDENVYCLSEKYSAVNVYNKVGRFLYSIELPHHVNGEAEIYTVDEIVCIADRETGIYMYRSGKFLKRLECDYENDTVIVYDQRNEKLYSTHLPNTDSYCIPYLADDKKVYVDTCEKALLKADETYKRLPSGVNH